VIFLIVINDERFVLAVYFSTLLKSDQWLRESHHLEQGIRGAINWRNIPRTNIYALGQPTVSQPNLRLQATY
jgi:hypothetical protein